MFVLVVCCGFGVGAGVGAGVGVGVVVKRSLKLRLFPLLKVTEVENEVFPWLSVIVTALGPYTLTV